TSLSICSELHLCERVEWLQSRGSSRPANPLRSVPLRWCAFERYPSRRLRGDRMANSTYTRGPKTVPPRGGADVVSLLLHMFKTIRLAGSVLGDPRVHWAPKFAFVGSIGMLALALFFPETLMDIFGGAVTAGLFDVFGIPAEAGIDWVALSVFAFNLLKLFPAEV